MDAEQGAIPQVAPLHHPERPDHAEQATADTHPGFDHHRADVAAARTGERLSPSSVQRLQRTVGNRAVAASVQRHTDGATLTDEAPPEAAPSVPVSPVLDVIGKGGGHPLATDVRSDMEARLGTDFGDVRIHTDSGAAASAEAMSASAYTVGHEIVFGHGAYSPDSTDGRRTLAHELTHVQQQRSGPVAGTDDGTGVRVSDPGDEHERAAVANAERALSDPASAVGPAGPGPSAAPPTSAQRSVAVADEAGSNPDAIAVQRKESGPTGGEGTPDVSDDEAKDIDDKIYALAGLARHRYEAVFDNAILAMVQFAQSATNMAEAEKAELDWTKTVDKVWGPVNKVLGLIPVVKDVAGVVNGGVEVFDLIAEGMREEVAESAGRAAVYVSKLTEPVMQHVRASVTLTTEDLVPLMNDAVATGPPDLYTRLLNTRIARVATLEEAVMQEARIPDPKKTYHDVRMAWETAFIQFLVDERKKRTPRLSDKLLEEARGGDPFGEKRDMKRAEDQTRRSATS